MTSRQYCPFHTDEDLPGTRIGDGGGYMFTCERTLGHPHGNSHTWMEVPEPADLPGLSDLAEEMGLAVELPAAIAKHPGQWLEYGVVEAAYAEANPHDFASLVARYGHTALAATRYSTSSFLAGTLGRLSRTGEVLFRPGRATGRWAYNSQISWWAVAPEPARDALLSWEDLGRSMDYVPGVIE